MQNVLSITAAGNHQVWAHAAAGMLRVLLALEDFEGAFTEGLRLLAQCEEADLGYCGAYIRMPLAVAQSACGQHAAAAAQAQQVITEFESLGLSGLNPMLAWEARARVALQAGDVESFVHSVDRFAQLLELADSPCMRAKYQRLLRDGTPLRPPIVGEEQTPAAIEARMVAVLGRKTGAERRRRALEFLLAETHTSMGFLYILQQESVELAATSTQDAPPPDVDERAREWLSNEACSTTREATTATTVNDGVASNRYEWSGADGSRYYPILLAHPEGQDVVVTGLGVVRIEPGTDIRQQHALAACLSRAATLLRRPA